MSPFRHWLLALPLAVAACGDSTGVTSLTGDATAGKALYAAHCQSCHGATGTVRANAAGEAKGDPAEAAFVILHGKEEMPAYAGTLSNQQVADLLAYLKTL
jgi:mono/diheme cytochrome c family protein